MIEKTANCPRMRLLVQGEKLCFDFSVAKEKYLLLKKFAQKVSSDRLKLLVSKKLLIGFVVLTRLVKTNGEIV